MSRSRSVSNAWRWGVERVPVQLGDQPVVRPVEVDLIALVREALLPYLPDHQNRTTGGDHGGG
jgi:hypothetical protein